MKARFEKIDAGENRLFGAHEYWSLDFGAFYHFHPEVELTAILSGAGRRIVGDHIGAFSAGDLVLMGADIPHQYAGSGARGRARGAGCVVVQFLPEALGERFLGSADGAPLRVLLEKSRRGIVFPAAVARAAIPKLRALARMEGPARFIALLEVLQALAAGKGARPLASRGHAPFLDARNASRVSRVCTLLQRRFTESLGQADAAAFVGLSPSAFSRMFRRATGLTFTRFLTGVRLSEACRLLVETDETIAAICHRCGFENLSNFNRRFLAENQMTPREFRRAASHGQDSSGSQPFC